MAKVYPAQPTTILLTANSTPSGLTARTRIADPPLTAQRFYIVLAVHNLPLFT